MQLKTDGKADDFKQGVRTGIGLLAPPATKPKGGVSFPTSVLEQRPGAVANAAADTTNSSRP
jgi:hypothetical protein